MAEPNPPHSLASDRRLPAGRQADLAAYVAEAGHVTVAALAKRYGVSTDTIRRDLDQLDAAGVLVRAHGGAVSLGSVPRKDSGLNVRLQYQKAEKEKIGELAAGLVDDGSVIMINAGTTALALTRHLRHHRNLTIATNNLLLPSNISSKVFRNLYIFGGSVRIVSQATNGPVRFHVGPESTSMSVKADLALIAVGGVSAENGCSTTNLAEAAMMAEMMSRASRVAVLADSSKLGRDLFAQVADLRSIDYLVTDAMPSEDLGDALAENEVRLVTPDTSGG